ncbi:MAG: hypothetical protein JNJ54_37475 [Myxococcaceae bacterium]|nr:hypothetical protein [Myxococcaceae bacterium]
MPEPITSRRSAGTKRKKKAPSRARQSDARAASERPARPAKPPQPRAPLSVFLQKLRPSPELARVIGKRPVARTDAIKKLWVYLRRNNLQNPADPRMFDLDGNLRGVFGDREQVSMFELSSGVLQHLLPLP